MQFYDIWTSYNAIGKEKYKTDWQKYYNDAIIKKIPYPELDDRRFKRETLALEWAWTKAGKPYYQVWPGVIDEFIRTRIDIDAELLKPPHDVFAIKIPKLEEPILSYKYEGRLYYIESILV